MISHKDVLDHGYVSVVEAWGRGEEDFEIDYECGIIEAARQSTQGSFRGWENGDAKLLKFLHDNQHSTPFEFAGMVVEVQAPIFVVREWHRHRTFSYNEMSARYEPLPDLYYIPTVERLMLGQMSPCYECKGTKLRCVGEHSYDCNVCRGTGELKSTNKQAGTAKDSRPLTEAYARAARHRLIDRCREFQADYEQDLANGVPKEIARAGMPVNHYTRMRASANLRNWLAFLKLRMAPNAQFEIREYANAVHAQMHELFPQTMRLFDEGD